MRTLIASIGTIGSLLFLLCCGGLMLLSRFVGPPVDEEHGSPVPDARPAAEAETSIAGHAGTEGVVGRRVRVADVVELEIPTGFERSGSFEMYGANSVAFQKSDDEDAMLLVMDISSKEDRSDTPEVRESLLEVAQEAPESGTDMKVSRRERREFTIEGRAIPFHFLRGESKSTRHPLRGVVGTFPTRKGIATVIFVVHENNYLPGDATRLIDSIRTENLSSDAVSEPPAQ